MADLILVSSMQNDPRCDSCVQNQKEPLTRAPPGVAPTKKK